MRLLSFICCFSHSFNTTSFFSLPHAAPAPPDSCLIECVYLTNFITVIIIIIIIRMMTTYPLTLHHSKHQCFAFSTLMLLVGPLPSARQHQSYGDCLEVKREYYQNSSVLDCVTQCSHSTAHLCEQFLQVQTDWVCHIGTLTLCVEAVA